MKNANDGAKLAARYSAWSTEDLVRATTLEAEEYTPEAIGLMRQELQERGLTLEGHEAVEGQVVDQVKRSQESLVGIRGWLRVFVFVLGLNSLILLSGIFTLDWSLPWVVNLAIVSEAIVGLYALVAFFLLVARYSKAPQHAQTVLMTIGLVAIGWWIAFYWQGLTPGLFPINAVGFACIWWSYLSYSKRVKFTYAPRTEDLVEPEVT